MPQTMCVIPAPGRQVRHPGSGRVLGAAGELVPRSAYWLRRLADGDISESPQSAPVPEDAPAENAAGAPEPKPTRAKKPSKE